MDKVAFGTRHIARGVGRMSQLVFEKASGSWVHATDGKTYLDFTTGIGVTSTGHCHPRVVKAAQDQIGKMIHGQVNIGFHQPMLQLIDRLIPIMPGPKLDTFFFSNSGAEAVEAAVKLARHATGKPNVIVMQHCFHGRTIGTMALTQSKTIYKAGFGPLMPGVFVAPFPYCQRCPTNLVMKKHGIGANAACSNQQDPRFECCNSPIDGIEAMLKQQTAPSETAAIILEPVLGEGGYVVPPLDFLQKLRKLCDKHGILLVADEVQTGFCRTGKYFAVEHSQVVPDILVMAKGIASGFPLSGIASSKELMDKQPPGSMGGTYAGNAVSCAAACATLDVIKEENLLENVNARGKQLMEGLKRIQHDSRWKGKIADVRGLGLMIGVEFDAPAGTAYAVAQACLRHGMLILTTSIYETLRFIPPLNVSEAEVNTALNIFVRALEETIAPID